MPHFYLKKGYVMAKAAPNKAAETADYRQDLLSQILRTPHGDASYMDIHKSVLEADPNFYAKFVLWYSQNTIVRDHLNFGISLLLNNTKPEDREERYTGHALLQKLPAHQVAKISMLSKRVSKAFKKAVREYLVALRSRPDYDYELSRNRKHIKYLYVRFGKLKAVKPDDRTQKILFDNDVTGSVLLSSIAALRSEPNADKQAEIIVTNKIPFAVARPLVTNISPAILGAFVFVMNDHELLTNINYLTNNGLNSIPELAAVVKDRLKKAGKSNSKVAVGRITKVATDHMANVDTEVRDAFAKVADNRLAAAGKEITSSIALFVDCSGSMEGAIELGRVLSRTICGIVPKLVVYTVGPSAVRLKFEDEKSQVSIDNTFKKVRAIGMTALGGGIADMIKRNEEADVFVLITDEQENSSPTFVSQLKLYCEKAVFPPKVFIINVTGNSSEVQDALKASKIPVDWNAVVIKDADTESITAIVHYLKNAGNISELLGKILELDLPRASSNFGDAF